MKPEYINQDHLNTNAFEIASLAVQLASFRNEKKPALSAAVDLLIQAHDEVCKIKEFNKRDYCEPAIIWHDLSPLKEHPFNQMDSFDGGDQISARVGEYPTEGLGLIQVLKLISGEKNEERCLIYRDKFAQYVYKSQMNKAGSIEEIMHWGKLNQYFIKEFTIVSPHLFWRMARNLAPFCPRLRKFYPNTNINRKIKQGEDGKFISTKSARSDSGKYEKRKKRQEVLDTIVSVNFPRRGRNRAPAVP